MEGITPEEKLSLVEQKRQEAFKVVLEQLQERLQSSIGTTFEAHGREYPLTSPEDCMVAYAQMMQSEVKSLYTEIVARNDYREEQAIAKLLELFTMYERLIALYTELRSYYPKAASKIEEHIPSLSEIAEHGERLWNEVQEHKD